MRVLCVTLLSISGMLWGQSAPTVVTSQKSTGTRAAAQSAPPAARVQRLAETAVVQIDPLTSDERNRKPRGYAKLTGVVRAVTSLGEERLDWSGLADGRRDGQMEIDWPGAARLRLHFTGFDANGGEVWLRGGNGEALAGPLTDRGPYEDGDFWTEPVAGDQVVVEWSGPASASPKFRVDRIGHEWMASGAPGSSCQADVSCYPEYATPAKAVASIDVVSDDGSLHYCSGVLITTKNARWAPLFITANHCVSSDTEARSVVAYWNYQTSKCNGTAPDRTASPKVTGARYLSSVDFTGGDYALLKLNAAPDGAVYLGWNATMPAQGSKTIGIHHPGAPPDNWKRISIGEKDYDRNSSIYIDDGADVALVPEQYYVQVAEKIGHTIPGSSGSPLMNDKLEMIGVLSYGRVPLEGDYCDIAAQSSYGKFSVIYPQIQGYLEEIQPPVSKVSPSLLSYRVVDGDVQAPERRSVTLTTDSKSPISYRITTSAPWLVATQAIGAVSASQPAQLEFFIAPGAVTSAGKLRATATISLVTAAVVVSNPVPVVVTVDLDATLSKPLVSATVSPNPVVELPPSNDGLNYEFQLKLEEKAGMAVRITSLVMDGQDKTPLIRQILGTDRLAPRGVIEAKIRAYLQPDGTERSFVFGGFAPASGQRWSATAKAKFVVNTSSAP
jgi:V8-like Glu-specific endopeptidase